jgi:predicted DNA-binding protein
MKMDKQVQVRMPFEMWQHLQFLAGKRAPGTTPALLIREAILKTFFQNEPEITLMDRDDQPKKQENR